MWKFAPKPNEALSDCSDDDISSNTSREEGLECPICCESFNVVENVPYVLWCGHTLCKNCVLGLQWAVATLSIQLPFFISCPWCNLLSFRLVYKGNLQFPRKNYFLLWMVESINGDRMKSCTHFCGDHNPAVKIHRRAPFVRSPEQAESSRNEGEGRLISNFERFQFSLCKSLVLILHLTANFPLVIIFLLIVLYAIPASAAILVLYILITILFALPSFLVLYFAYPSLDWLVKEIIA